MIDDESAAFPVRGVVPDGKVIGRQSLDRQLELPLPVGVSVAPDLMVGFPDLQAHGSLLNSPCERIGGWIG